jgi:hypothetical protein
MRNVPGRRCRSLVSRSWETICYMGNFYLHSRLACLEGDADPLPLLPVPSVLSIHIYRKLLFTEEIVIHGGNCYARGKLLFTEEIVVHGGNCCSRRKLLFTCPSLAYVQLHRKLLFT